MNRYKGGARVTSDKINFVRANVVNYQCINPFTDMRALQEVKELLCKNGFYKNPPSMIMDTSIQNIIQEAKGEHPMRHTSTTARKLKSV